jgi:hypothetical protein
MMCSLLLKKPKAAVCDVRDVRGSPRLRYGRGQAQLFGSSVGQIVLLSRKDSVELLLPKPKVAGSRPVVRLGQAAR